MEDPISLRTPSAPDQVDIASWIRRISWSLRPQWCFAINVQLTACAYGEWQLSSSARREPQQSHAVGRGTLSNSEGGSVYERLPNLPTHKQQHWHPG
jgi:hypothetical protein